MHRIPSFFTVTLPSLRHPLGAVLFLLILAYPSANAPNYEKIIQTAQQRYGAKGTQMLQQWRDMMQRTDGLAERLRRENTTEMLLEPITGLDGEPFRLPTDSAKMTDGAGLAKLATALEEKAEALTTV